MLKLSGYFSDFFSIVYSLHEKNPTHSTQCKMLMNIQVQYIFNVQNSDHYYYCSLYFMSLQLCACISLYEPTSLHCICNFDSIYYIILHYMFVSFYAITMRKRGLDMQSNQVLDLTDSQRNRNSQNNGLDHS